MHPGEENSGKLVSTVRREARQAAAASEIDVIIVDGSPGVGCPVIASLTNADLALVVAEPTPSGVHDALRVIELARKMHIPTALCVNRWDISPSWTDHMERDAADLGVTLAGRVRDDAQVVAAQMDNCSIIESADIPAAHDVRRLWRRLERWIAQPPLTQTVP
jgi:MinD superfamily P-loop ATPase